MISSSRSQASRLIGRVVPLDEVSARDRSAMFTLMQDYYLNVTRADFERDLAEKQWVIQTLDPTHGDLLGFSTQRLLTIEVDGTAIRVLFSGDTIMHRDYWGQNPLAGTWGRFALSLLEAYPHDTFYWFLISKGYRTYRYLPVFFREFYPRAGMVTPPWARRILDHLGTTMFATRYDPVAGVVAAGATDCRLRPGVADVSASRKNRDIQFFVAANPGHARGDELCCLAPLTRTNFTAAAYRVMGLSASES